MGRSKQISMLPKNELRRYKDNDASLDDLQEAVTTLEEIERTARRVLGGAHPLKRLVEQGLREARLTLASRSTRPR